MEEASANGIDWPNSISVNGQQTTKNRWWREGEW